MIVTKNGWASLAFVALALVPLTDAPVFGQDTGIFMNPLEERALGVRAHPSVLAEAGGAYPDQRLTSYVQSLGMQIARNHARHPDQFVFSLVNDPNVNASTMPGGFVYINAGILAWVNDEAELAALIGHEVGHAINRHAAKKQSRRNVSRLIYRMKTLRPNGAEDPAQLREALMLRNIAYAQDREFEADQVGFMAAGKLGLDSMGAARMLYMLQRHHDWFATLGPAPANEPPSYLQSHPSTIERVRRAVGYAEESGGTDRPRNRERFLSMIDGMRLFAKTRTGTTTLTLRVITVGPSDTLATLARRHALRNPEQHILAINGLESASDIKPGMRLKIITAPAARR